MAATKQVELLTLEGAKVAIAASEKKAKELGIDMNIAIVDSSLYLLHFSRMPGAKLTSISIAIDKAFTAAGHRQGTHLYKEAVRPGGPGYGLQHSNGGRFMIVGGGLPIVNSRKQVIGAIGTSSGTPAQDQQVSQAGVDALEALFARQDSGIKSKL